MSSSSESDYISDEDVADQFEEFSTSYNSLGSKFMGLKPYSFEPEKVIKDSSCSKDEDEEDPTIPFNEKKQYSRVGKKEWCLCERCRVEEREIDCVCCQEEAAISDEKFDGK